MTNHKQKSIQPEKTNFKKLSQLTQLKLEEPKDVCAGLDTGDPASPGPEDP